MEEYVSVKDVLSSQFNFFDYTLLQH